MSELNRSVNDEIRIKAAGSGGQGIVLAGNIIARAAVLEGRTITGMVSYGVEMRGGTANATVIVSDNEIASPVVDYPGHAIILNQPSFDRFEPLVVENGLIVFNSSLVEPSGLRSEVDYSSIPATDIAKEMGDVRVANMVILGGYVRTSEIFNSKTVEQSIENLFSSKNPKLIDLNIRAFREGFEKVHKIQELSIKNA
jgi:2-oxoglutarate ferredoxin oxidoreductase subunit gamma